jgi:hypothetical protein
MRLWTIVVAACTLMLGYLPTANADGAPSYCNFPTAPISLPAKYMNPPMMAIGDSVYNGVRTLSITPQMPQYSPPALVAGALNEATPFVIPQYPMPVITDFERALSSPVDLGLAVARMKQNLTVWLNNAPTYSGALLFDNISMASARAEDLLNLNWEVADQKVGQIKSTVTPDENILDLDLFDLFEYVNARFVIDPGKKPGISQSPDLSHLAPLAQVALRKPKRLLVNIGANNGYWSLAFDASDVLDTTDNVPATVEFEQKFPEHMMQVVACLAALSKGPDGVQHIYVNNLPHLSVLANLMPLDRNTLGPLPGCDKKYYASYYNYFGQGYGVVDGKTVCEWDKAVDAVNARVQQIIKDTGDQRIVVVDIASAVRQYDEKHLLDAAKTITLDQQYLLDNWPVAGMYPLFPHAGGGLFEGDNMHPSASGYSIIADAVLVAIAATEGGSPKTVNLDALYRANPNAVFPPIALISAVAEVYRDYRIAQKGGWEGVQARIATQSHAPNYQDAVMLMRAMSKTGNQAAASH